MTSRIESQTLTEARLYRQTKAALIAKDVELRRTKQQLQQATKALRGAHLAGRQLEAARTDAHQLIAFAVAHASTSRRECARWGIGKRHWRRAVLLVLAALDAYPALYAGEAVDTLANDLTSNPKALRRAGLRYGKADIESLGERIRAATHAADVDTTFLVGRGPRFSDRLALMGSQK